MRYSPLLLAGTITCGAMLVAATANAAATPSVSTVAGTSATSNLSSPGGIALDQSGDLFIADTNHCRVLLVPSHSGHLYGISVTANRPVTLVGGACGARSGPGYPTGVAVDSAGTLYIAEATSERVQAIHSGSHSLVTVAGNGTAGFNGNGLVATSSQLNKPFGVGVDAAGDLLIADTANCRVRVVPTASGVHFSQSMLAGHLYSVAGSGTCGSDLRDGPATSAQLANPIAVAVDPRGNLFVADNGDQSVLEIPVVAGTDYGTTIAAGGIATVVGSGGNNPYLEDGLPAAGDTAELNDPEGIAVAANGTLYISDGSQHNIKVVPAVTTQIFGRAMNGGDLYTLAGAIPTNSGGASGNGTRWILTTMGVPVGVAVTSAGSVLYSDRSANLVRQIR